MGGRRGRKERKEGQGGREEGQGGRKGREGGEGGMGWKGWREGERDRGIQNHVYKQGTITIRCSMLLKQSGGHRRTTHLDLLGERGREHHGLALAHRRHPILLHNATDLRLKPHVQHTVSLVQHQIPCEGGREEREGEGK